MFYGFRLENDFNMDLYLIWYAPEIRNVTCNKKIVLQLLHGAENADNQFQYKISEDKIYTDTNVDCNIECVHLSGS